MFRNALVSCSDKTGLVEFLTPLQKQGLRIVSTGGTAKHLTAHGLTVVDVSEQTQFAEVMDGRVKTLHPKIHMALLARATVTKDQQLLADFGLDPFDLVVVNLYPFEQAVLKRLNDEELIECIDVGGPSMLRAAAKNFSQITVVCDPNDYPSLLNGEWGGPEGRRRLAVKVFSHTSTYDALIAETFESSLQRSEMGYPGARVQSLRYGENPQQQAVWLRRLGVRHGLHRAHILQGKELSYNNLLDLDAATRALRDLQSPMACVAVKHNSPCGAAVAKTLLDACQAALAADPVSVFGGIIALSDKVTGPIAAQMQKIFLECVIAPDFDGDALTVFAAKKNVRLLKWPEILTAMVEPRWRSVAGGALVQETDVVTADPKTWTYWGNKPNAEIERDLQLAWRVCAHLKSNAIAIVAQEQTRGLGMGQVNRVDAVEQALARLRQFHPGCREPVLASDAFFPFSDSVEKAFAAGIRWIIQPGGSVKDLEIRRVAEKLGVHIVITGERHFLH